MHEHSTALIHLSVYLLKLGLGPEKLLMKHFEHTWRSVVQNRLHMLQVHDLETTRNETT